MNIRLDKYLADSGFGTRSNVKLLVRSGSVLVNNKIVKDAGIKINTETDEVIVKGDPMPAAGIPESLNVLVHELRGLGLSVTLD